MTQREAKIEALRIATAQLNNPPMYFEEDGVSLEDQEKICKELDKIAESLRLRAVKLGGEFNRYTGY